MPQNFNMKRGIDMALTFEQWKRQVDNAIGQACGLSSDDLADCTYRDWYDSDVTPNDAAQMALEENDFPFDED
jgi:hypothetical protein